MDECLDELAEQATTVTQPAGEAASADLDTSSQNEREVAGGFIRLADFIKKNKKNVIHSTTYSKRAMVLAAYQKQIGLGQKDPMESLIPATDDDHLRATLPYRKEA